jgi:NAD(P)-dependent dehydrogenase (short-subunit alcohol dehydrogenase family)
MLKDKSILIVGGTSGIGITASKAFVEEGAKVLAIGLETEESKFLQSQFPKEITFKYKDAREEKTVSMAIEVCIELYGSFDGLYHIAGGSGRKFGDGPLHEMSLEGWDETFNLNLTSMMLSNRAAVNSFLKHRKSGSILNLSSVLGSHPSPRYFTTHAYATSKAAIEGLVKSTAAYYAKNNIRINAIAPGLVESPMSKRAMEDEAIQNFIRTKQPLDGGRNGNPKDLIGAAIYFMSDYSRFTTGQLLKIDGGWSVSEGQY